MTNQPADDSAIPLVHESDPAVGSSFPGLEDAPTQVRPHSALSSAGTPMAGETPPTAQVLGARLDHFELLDSIGVGGMGRVFRARDTRLDRLVALKVLSPELSSDPEICRRFEQEAKAAARLDDRHFARVYFFGFDKGLRYIAMEYVEGENIRQKINKSGKLPLPMVLNVGVQIAQGLAHAASCGVVHRDIKPSNIIFAPDGTAKLVDMGLARNFFQSSSPASELTQAGVTLGTFDYISPEQALDPRDADVRSDIYSLGCTLYHAITGQPPFSKGSALQKILQHQNDTVPDPRRWVPDLPESVVSILMKMLAKNPQDRYQHPVELIEDLRVVAFALEVPLPDEGSYRPAPRVGPSFWETHLTWILPLVALIVGLAAYAWFDQPSGPARTSSTPANSVDDDAVPTSSLALTNGSRVASRPRPTESPAAPSPPQRRRVLVPNDGDLRQAIKQAPAGTDLRLAGRRYVLADAGDGDGIRTLLLDRDLRIEPEAATGLVEIEVRTGVWNDRPMTDGNSLIRVRNASVEMRRLAWIVKSTGDTTVSRSLFGIAGGRLRLDDCFVRVAGSGREEPLAMVQMEGSETRRLGTLVAHRTLFHGADEAIRILSPTNTEVELIDSAIDQTGRSPFRLEGLGDVGWSMDHVSVRTLATPLFRVQRLGGVRIQARDCVFSHVPRAAESEVPFIDFSSDGTWASMTDSWWSGRGNLFHGFQPITISRAGQPIARSLRQARPLGFDETAMVTVDRPEDIWANPADGPVSVSAESGPALADRLKLLPAYVEREEGPFGCRVTPWGDLYGTRLAADPSTVPETTGPVDRATSPPRAIIFDPSAEEGAEPFVFRKLSDAVAQVESSATIEVRVNGLVEVSPVLCESKKIVIRSAAGYSPVLWWDATSPTARPGASLFDLGSLSRLSLENIALVVRTDGDSPVGVASAKAGAEMIVQESSILIDGNLMKSRAFLCKQTDADAGSSSNAVQVRVVRSTIRTSGILMSALRKGGGGIQVTDSFVVTARPLLFLDGPAGDIGPPLQIERSTLLLGESLLSCAEAPADGEATSKLIRISTRDSLLLGYGTSALFEFKLLPTENEIGLPARWSSERTFVTGFPLAWRGGTGEGTEPSATMGELSKGNPLLEGSITVGASEPFVLGTGGIKTVQVPLIAQLRRLGYPVDSPQLLGVAAQLLPPEPSPSAQR